MGADKQTTPRKTDRLCKESGSTVAMEAHESPRACCCCGSPFAVLVFAASTGSVVTENATVHSCTTSSAAMIDGLRSSAWPSGKTQCAPANTSTPAVLSDSALHWLEENGER